jgi:hypothetical protein
MGWDVKIGAVVSARRGSGWADDWKGNNEG